MRTCYNIKGLAHTEGIIMFRRDLSGILKEYSKFPVLALLGPRQSGKTTLAQATFPNHRYVSLEDVTERTFAATDPKRFLHIHENEHGIILDEFQYVPEILSYIQLIVDAKKRPGYFILVWSQNFPQVRRSLGEDGSNQAISQSLAGRVGILTLLPLSIAEMQQNSILPSNVDQLIFNGSYPRLYEGNFLPGQLYPSYIQTYLERDVRILENIGDLTTFARFAQLCAGRVGQTFKLENLGSEVGITTETAKRWISVLEASYIIFLLQPHFKNFNKRVTKSPKLYFYDTGIACSLLRIHSVETLMRESIRGALFENLIIADLYKQYYNQGVRPPLYFWRDQNGRYEIDCLVEQSNLQVKPVEIKSGETITADYFKGLDAWREISGKPEEHGYVIYGGSTSQDRTKGMVLSWQDVGSLIKRLA